MSPLEARVLIQSMASRLRVPLLQRRGDAAHGRHSEGLQVILGPGDGRRPHKVQAIHRESAHKTVAN